MALDITAAQGGTSAITEPQCCIYIPDNSANVPTGLPGLQIQIKAVFDFSISLNNWISSWFSGNAWSLVQKTSTNNNSNHARSS